MDLEEYLQCVYDSEVAYHNNQFDPNDPVLKKQERYLEAIATEDWVDLVELLKGIKQEGMQSDSFHVFHDKLYEQKIIFPFKWHKRYEGQKALNNPNTDFSNCSLFQILMYFPTIFRADRFSEGTIQQCLDNGVLIERLSVKGDYLNTPNSCTSFLINNKKRNCN
jgi:hypothetical protein